MKSISFSFFLVLCSLLPGRLMAQLYCGAPDFIAAQAYKSVYYDFVTDLSSKVFSGEVQVYNDPSLNSLLSITDRGSFLAESYEVEDMDPNTGDFILLTVRDTLRGPNWSGIHFELNYIFISVNGMKSLYIPNKEKNKLNKTYTQLLEKLQSEAHLELINYENIGNHGHQVYDALQIRIFDGVQAGKIPIYRVDSVNLAMPLSYFNTAYIVSDTVLVESEYGEAIVQVYHSELTAGSVTGTGIRGSFLETSDGWHMEGQFYSINYSPVFAGIEFPPQPMCWIKREDLKSFLSAEDWLFLQELWGFALQEKLKRPFNSSDF